MSEARSTIAEAETAAWNFIRKIECLPQHKIEEVFGVENKSIFAVTNNFTYAEAKNKYNEWLKQLDSIKIGDEVICENGLRVVITRIAEDYFNGIDDKGSFYAVKEPLKKTKNHYSEIEKLFAKMRGE